MIGRVPDFVQKMARRAMEDWARERNLTRVERETVVQAMKELLPENM